MRLMNIEVKNFRGIHHASVNFPCNSRIVCLIGPGDSGKSTLLKAIEWVLWPTWNLNVTDTDFFNCDTTSNIEIAASLAELPDALLKEDKFGLYLRDYDKVFLQGGVDDEPTDDGTLILTIRLTIDESLEPRWEVITNRTDPRPITHKDRRMLGFGTVGFDHEKDFQWGRGSVLQKYADSHEALHNAFTQAMRNAMQTVDLQDLDEIAPTMIEIGRQYGVSFHGDLHSKLLMQNGTYSTTVGVFDDNVPFSQRGLGSKRLLSIGMNINSYSDGTMVLVDEIETGLEPYRIISLIAQFRAQFSQCGQLIMTTHSKSVICECTVDELHIVRNKDDELKMISLGLMPETRDSIQKMLRGNPDAFLCKRIIVCEGKTEIGFIRAFDEYLYTSQRFRFANNGVSYALGEGSNTFSNAKFLKSCGYDVCIFMDSDKPQEQDLKSEVEEMGIKVFSWEPGYAIEEQIFHDFPITTLSDLVNYAVTEKSFEHVVMMLKKNLPEKTYTIHEEEHKIVLNQNITTDECTIIGAVAKANNDGWFKRIDRGQKVGEIVLSALGDLPDCGFSKTINALQQWVIQDET